MKAITPRRSTGALAASMLAAAALSSPASAGGPGGIDWKSPVEVRTRDGVELQDADFSGREVVIASQEPVAGGPMVVIEYDVSARRDFRPAVFKHLNARQVATDLCDGLVEVVYAHEDGPGDWVIENASGAPGGLGSPIEVDGPVSSATGLARFPDVACTDHRSFITWYQRDGDVDRLQLAHKRTFGSTFSEPIDLGEDDRDFRRSLAVAGADDSAYTVFARSDGDLRFKRFDVGSGPGKPVTGHPTQVIGPGTPGDSADAAVIAAAGDKVAVAWLDCDAMYARVSDDRGQTWGPIRELVPHAICGGDFGALPRSLAIRGDRMVLSYLAFSFFGPGFVGLVSTTNDFATFDDEPIAQGDQDEHLVGFIRAEGVIKLGAAFDTGDRIRFRRED